MDSSATAELKANATLALAPTKSQNFLVLGLILVASALAASVWLFYLQQPTAGFAFLAFASIFSFGLFYCWFRSQRDADLDGARATQIKVNKGMTISTDPRVLNHPSAVDGLARLLEAVQRQPLPLADGLVENGQVIPHSEQAARGQTDRINAVAQAGVSAALDAFGLSKPADVVLQEGLLSVPPPTPVSGAVEVNSAVG